MAVAIPHTFKVARVASTLHTLPQACAPESDEFLRHMMDETCRALPDGSVQLVKVRFAEQVYQRVQRTPPDIWDTILWLLLYGGSLALAVFGPLVIYAVMNLT